ncbi:MAG: bifunctional folylpolyglutamate synthase/dihydrofolate synthase, partial [Chloroflexi bacterium]|nr:bifunctional folylpolyglutamate synthase/dihydrofolate synthase [Chloroflexota bacterium]
MDYREAERYVLSLTDYEKTPFVAYTATTYDLRRVEDLLARLGNPHLVARTAHVAGTKGKGSTTAMIASVLSASGYRTGLYTSPHFHSLRERIRIDGAMINESEFASATERVQRAIEAMNNRTGAGLLTTFELLTAIAFYHFAQGGVQYQSVEVGLGGRLDATNVVQAGVCVITSISLDHTEVLGKTLPAIAAEKAGIIKTGTTVVCAPQAPGVDAVIAGRCRGAGAKLVRVGADVSWEAGAFDSNRQALRVHGRLGDYEVEIPLLGEHQMENAACAVAALEVLAEQGGRITAESISSGLASVAWPGRLQVLGNRPWLVCDGAHNA